MTTGNTSFQTVVKTLDGWPFYHYGRRIWSGGDTAPGSRPKTKVFKTYRLRTYETINGKRVLVVRDVLRSRLVPSRLRNPEPHNYVVNGFEMVQDDYKIGYQGGGTWSFGFINEPEFPSFYTANDDIALYSKLREKIAGSSFNAAVTTAESTKALKMIGDSATRMYKFYTNFRRGNFPRAVDELFAGRRELRRPSKRASSNWLELKYGWLPLINDTYEGAQFLATAYAPRVFRISAVRHAEGFLGTRKFDSPIGGFPFGNGNVMANFSQTESKRILALLKEVNVPALAGLHDPLSVAWELLPYSFVLDWFIPVGNYLQARALPQALSGTYVSSYRRKQKLNHFWLKQTDGGSDVIWKKRPDQAQYEQYQFIRDVSFVLPAPPLPKVKPLEKALSWTKALTSVALLVGLRK